MNKLKTYFLYLTVFITGGVILIIEILGTRILAPFYGSTIFVWSSLISVTLGALALGYLLGGLLADKKPEIKIFYGIIFLAGIFTAIVMKIDQPLLVFSDRFGLRFGPLVAAKMLFAAPLFLLGMVTPFAIRLRAQFIEKVGMTSGSIFAFATVGSLAGALLAGFFLVPVFSLSAIFAVSGALLIVVALLGVFLFTKAQRPRREFFLTLLVAVLFGTGLFYFPKFLYDKDSSDFKIVHQEQSFYADLKVIQGKGSRCLLMDGSPQTCIVLGQGISPARYIAELNRLSEFWPKNSRVLLLGLGAGAIVKSLNKEFSIDIVELDQRIAELAQEYFGFELDENDRLFVDDARSFLKKTDKSYDIIISDLYFGNTIPVYLYTKEAVNFMKQRLAKGGVLITNIVGQLKGKDNLVVSLIRTQAEVFPNIIITTDNPKEPSSNILVHAFSDENYKPLFEGRYKEQNINYEKGIIITDAKNPLELLLVKTSEEFLTGTKKMLGYKVLFGL